ncbi:uncharacterized protein TNCV_2672071 [Trichonephila clavipes]|nr:uncharacterized protein TNCV_2672071 [Trichonephila clavipes]
MSSIPVPLKTRCVGQRCTLNLSRAQTSCRWCSLEVRRGVLLMCRPRRLTITQNYEVRKWNVAKKIGFELYHSCKDSDIDNIIKIQRIKWAGHVGRMDEDRTTKKVFKAQPIGTRRKSRPNLRWIDGQEKYLLVLRTKNLRSLTRRLALKRLLQKAKAHPGLSNH